MAYRSATFAHRPPQRVVVTGAGILSAHGTGWQVNSDAFREGKVSLRPVTHFDVSKQRVNTAGEVEMPPLPPHRLGPRDLARMERGAELLIHAAHETITSAGLSLTNLPCVLGTSAGGMALGEAFF